MIYFSMPGGMELVLIVLLVVVFFGGKKIPELMRGLGQGIKEFKKAQHDLNNEIQKSTLENEKDALENKDSKK